MFAALHYGYVHIAPLHPWPVESRISCYEKGARTWPLLNDPNEFSGPAQLRMDKKPNGNPRGPGTAKGAAALEHSTRAGRTASGSRRWQTQKREATSTWRGWSRSMKMRRGKRALSTRANGRLTKYLIRVGCKYQEAVFRDRNIIRKLCEIRAKIV